ncbi:hypothetical protein [Mucilaginibacter xinganensis]|uniref:Uncharacterized protein n=1 Tax=Mucilaginibacter xinganensis TaxID=1234841 RepID=A0A223NQV2_9SPHI|nr:hypothetical protein [Mucilaginibacter xinganensis]ASU32289.1 hypothetical protein MuYL_0386 [Mucilaginibacter xinganensis]
MPTQIITTDGTTNPVMLSVQEVQGHRINTVIMVNHLVVATIDNNFASHIVGTNNGLKGNTVTVTTTSLKVTPSNNTEVDFTLDGAGPQQIDADKLQFPPGISAVPHFMTYFMV